MSAPLPGDHCLDRLGNSGMTWIYAQASLVYLYRHPRSLDLLNRFRLFSRLRNLNVEKRGNLNFHLDRNENFIALAFFGTGRVDLEISWFSSDNRPAYK